MICNVCNGKGHTAGGYRWSYKDTPLIIRERKKCGSNNKLKKKTLQFDLSMNLIAEYDSLTEASE